MRDFIKTIIRFAWALVIDVLHPRQWLRYRAARASHPCIFIVGCGHSGTSLLLAILGAHSHIFAVPEETGFAFDYGTGNGRRRMTAPLFLRYLDARAIQAGKLRWVEKTPRHILAIPVILGLRPRAKIIVIVRDGRDVAVSLAKRHDTIKEGIERWVEHNRAAEAYDKHPNLYRVRYEDLIADFENTMRKLLVFLGEDFESGVADYHKQPKFFYANSVEKPPDESDKNHKAFRNWQINQPLFDGRGRWHELGADDKRVIKKIGGQMLIDYGYVKDNDW